MASENRELSPCEKIGLKAITKENLFYYYIPIHGVFSYNVQAINVMNPAFMNRIMPKRDLTTALLLSSTIGAAFYIYGHPHLKDLERSRRGRYALVGGSLFSLGSVLLWSIIKSTLPKDNAVIAAVAGLGTGAAIIKIGVDFLADIGTAKKN